MNEKETKKNIKLDIIIISAVVALAILFVFLSVALRKPGNTLVVEIDGAFAGEYSLSENGVFTLNGGTNVLVVENGEAYLSFSDCPDHTCEKTGKIRYVGQSIICLPNRLSITVRGDSDGGVDLVS